MAGAFQATAFQNSPAFQTDDVPPVVVRPTPGSKYSPYPFDEIAREQRRQREAPPEPVEHVLEPEPEQSRYPAKRSQQQQRADAERRLFEKRREEAELARIRILEELVEADRIEALQVAEQARVEAIARLHADDEDAAMAFAMWLVLE